ncbi:chloride channel protein [Altererythrobacter sp. B11]|uniref:chloride channel protein n=1 Tax=Altererythrobacter sp. B11 TaxID=2060312 RepID=UPI000DC739C8|nr:chloride channel protein [Altererythrobacter sp. B11]BBC73682.1 chloride channel protein [Altererythrobacter sp. B11]
MPLKRRISRSFEQISHSEIFEVNQWQRRFATLAGALLVGAVAVFFAHLGDAAQRLFTRMTGEYPLLPLLLTPLLFAALAWITRRFVPETAGSGIPQVIAASRFPNGPVSSRLLSLRAAIAKLLLAIGALLGGASVGREGPTVQISAAIMLRIHRWLGVRLTPGVYIAGGAAGVSAAFNTPLAGIAFAIEELAVAYEQRVAVLVMGAVMISGLMAQGLSGNYVYFGAVSSEIPLKTMLLAAPIAGVVGGALGGLFSRCLLSFRGPEGRWGALSRTRPVTLALACGVVVAVLGVATQGSTWGTGYQTSVVLLRGGEVPLEFGPAKFIASLATAVSGIPGGIFAPSLAVGAGFGNLLAPLFAPQEAGAVVLLGMAGYFVGVVRAPLTAVIILSEATGSTAIILPLFATALIGDWTGSQICRARLYHVLATNFIPKDEPEAKPDLEEEDGEEVPRKPVD